MGVTKPTAIIRNKATQRNAVKRMRVCCVSARLSAGLYNSSASRGVHIYTAEGSRPPAENPGSARKARSPRHRGGVRAWVRACVGACVRAWVRNGLAVLEKPCSELSYIQWLRTLPEDSATTRLGLRSVSPWRHLCPAR